MGFFSYEINVFPFTETCITVFVYGIDLWPITINDFGLEFELLAELTRMFARLTKFKGDYCHRKRWDNSNVFRVFPLDSTQNDENTQPINLSKPYVE